MASDSTSAPTPWSDAAAAEAMTQLLVMYPTNVTVSMSRSRSQANRSVPAKTLPCLLGDRGPGVGAAALDLRVQGGAGRARVEHGRPGAGGVLHDHDREAGGRRRVDRRGDVRQGLGVGRVLDLERTVEVLLLDVDDDERAAGLVMVGCPSGEVGDGRRRRHGTARLPP